jgi:hypothetical protein
MNKSFLVLFFKKEQDFVLFLKIGADGVPPPGLTLRARSPRSTNVPICGA